MKLLKNLKNENGVVAIFVGLALIALVGIVAYVVDTGSIYQTRRSMQSAADAAALAGAQELPENPDIAAQVASDYAVMQSATISSSDVSVSIESTFVANDTIKVSVSDSDKKTFFAGIFGINSTSVGASATAMAGSPEEYIGVAPWGLLDGEYVYGNEYTLKTGTPPELGPGNFGALDIDGHGSNGYESAILNGAKTPLKIGDFVDTLTGAKASAVRDGVASRVALQPDGVWSDDLITADFALARSDSQFIIIPIISEFGNGHKPTQIINFKPFIISSYSGVGGKAEVIGTFLSEALIITDGVVKGYDNTGIKVIRLVK